MTVLDAVHVIEWLCAPASLHVSYRYCVPGPVAWGPGALIVCEEPSSHQNTYGPVRLEVGTTAIETGLLNLGSLIGDHAKTAIGTLLGTATVIGTGASVFGAVRPPKYVPPFAWGGSDDARMSRDGFLRTAERVLPRRDVTADAATRAMLGRIYDWATR